MKAFDLSEGPDVNLGNRQCGERVRRGTVDSGLVATGQTPRTEGRWAGLRCTMARLEDWSLLVS